MDDILKGKEIVKVDDVLVEAMAKEVGKVSIVYGTGVAIHVGIIGETRGVAEKVVEVQNEAEAQGTTQRVVRPMSILVMSFS